jgi:hypothetical protein
VVPVFFAPLFGLLVAGVTLGLLLALYAMSVVLSLYRYSHIYFRRIKTVTLASYSNPYTLILTLDIRD